MSGYGSELTQADLIFNGPMFLRGEIIAAIFGVEDSVDVTFGHELNGRFILCLLCFPQFIMLQAAQRPSYSALMMDASQVKKCNCIDHIDLHGIPNTTNVRPIQQQ